VGRPRIVGIDVVNLTVQRRTLNGELPIESKAFRSIFLGLEIDSPGLLKPVDQGLALLVSRNDEQSRGFGGLFPGLFKVGRGYSELYSLPHFVKLAFSQEAGFEELFGFLLLYSLPLPFGHSATKHARTTSHHSDLSPCPWKVMVWKLGF